MLLSEKCFIFEMLGTLTLGVLFKPQSQIYPKKSYQNSVNAECSYSGKKKKKKKRKSNMFLPDGIFSRCCGERLLLFVSAPLVLQRNPSGLQILQQLLIS